ncbi:hypothetical protein, partial [Streptomyces pseudogriseolus]
STDTIPLLHELDRIYSSLVRDFRIGQARMFASDDLLENLGAGKGSVRLTVDPTLMSVSYRSG